jgi:arabinogalactan oligomer / maltooligosaccharide transport system permease protein
MATSEPVPGVRGARRERRLEESRARERVGQGRRRERPPHRSILLHAGLITATAIALAPVAWVFLTSLKPRSATLSDRLELFHDPSLGAYREVLTGNDGLFLRWFANSTVIALLTTALGVFLAATGGYAFSRFRFPGYRPMLRSFLVTQMFPGIILIVPLFNILTNLRLVNTHIGLVIVYCTLAVPFCTMMLKSYFDTIPIELEEAARVDGLSPFGSFWRIALPLSVPGIAVTAFYSFLTAWNEFMLANILMTGDANKTLPVGISGYVDQFRQNWDLLTASAVLITVPALAFFYWAQRYLVTGLTAGGTKY